MGNTVSEYLGGVRVPGGLPRLQSGWDGRSPSGGFDSRPPPQYYLETSVTKLLRDLGLRYHYLDDGV